MAAVGEEARNRKETTSDNNKTDSNNTEFLQYGHQTGSPPYKNAREYAQALRPWLWQYYSMAAFHQMMSMCPPPCFQPASLSAASPSGDFMSRTQPLNNAPAPQPPQGQTVVNGNVPVQHRFQGKKRTFSRFSFHV